MADVYVERFASRFVSKSTADYVVLDHTNRVLYETNSEPDAIAWAVKKRHIPHVLRRPRDYETNDKKKRYLWYVPQEEGLYGGYYSIISRAASGFHLPSGNWQPKTSAEFYGRLRTTFEAQLESVRPKLREAQIVKERKSLEKVIEEVEEAIKDGFQFDSPINPEYALVAFRSMLEDAYPAKKSLPTIDLIPDQNIKGAIAFRPSRRGPLELLPDPPKDPFDPEQSQLYSRIRQQLEKLMTDIPNQERAQIEEAATDFLAQPSTWQQVEFKKVLWLCGNALRNTLAQHDAVKDSRDPHYSKLPPSVAEALRRPVESWNVFIFGDDDLIALDAKRVGPKEFQSAISDLAAAKPIIERAAANRDITTERAGEVLYIGLEVAGRSADNINDRQAKEFVAGTSKNLIIQLIRRAYLTCQSLADPKTDEDRAIITEYKKGIARAVGIAVAGAAIASSKAVVPHITSFFEFVLHNAPAIRGYVATAFQNTQLTQVIDAIEHVRLLLSSEEA